LGTAVEYFRPSGFDREKLTKGYKIDPWGNRIQVLNLHDESLAWLLPYQEVQNAGIKFA
jgi:hypothetical protein